MAELDVAAWAAIIFAVAVVGVICFQVALALGAPWGAYAMAGAYPGRFPPMLRLASVVQAVVLAIAGLLVLSRAGLLLPQLADASRWLIWLVVGFSVLSLVLNFLSPSAGERRIWVPVAAVMLVSSLAVALGPG